MQKWKIEKVKETEITGRYRIKSETTTYYNATDFEEQLRYNMRNGIETEIGGMKLTPTEKIENIDDVIRIFYKDIENIPVLTDGIHGIVFSQGAGFGVNGKGYYFQYNGEEYTYKHGGIDGGLKVTEEQEKKIEEIMDYVRKETGEK